MLPRVVDVTVITGEKILGQLTSWQTSDGPYVVEHLAGMSPNHDLLVFWWSPMHDWQVVNVSQKTGQKVAGPVTSWQTPDRPYISSWLSILLLEEPALLSSSSWLSTLLLDN